MMLKYLSDLSHSLDSGEEKSCTLQQNKKPFDNLMSSRYPPQFFNNQSERSSVVKQDGQKSVAFLPVVRTS